MTISPSFFFVLGGGVVGFFLHTGMFCLKSSCCFDRFFFFPPGSASFSGRCLSFPSLGAGGRKSMFEGSWSRGYLEKSLCQRDLGEVSLIFCVFYLNTEIDIDFGSVMLVGFVVFVNCNLLQNKLVVWIYPPISSEK